MDYRSRWQQKRRKRVTRQRLIIIVVCVLAGGAVVLSWLGIDRRAPEGFCIPGPDICWLAAGSDFIIVSGRSGRLTRVSPDLSASSTPWPRDFTHPAGFLAPPALTDTLALVGCADVRLRAIELATGLQAWEIETGGAVCGVTTDGEDIYFGSEDGFLRAASTDGSLRWQTQLGAPVVASPLVTNDKVIAATLAGEVHCLARTDGSHLWTVQTGAPIYASPRRGPSTIIVGDDAGKLHSITPDGQLTAEYVFEGLVRAAAGVADAVVVAGDSAGVLARINPADMSELWATRLPGPIAVEPVIVGDRIWCGAGSTLVAVDRQSGRILRRIVADAETTDVLAAFGRIYWATSDGKVVAISP